jgi:SAM-dependent methyltransferase
MFETKQDDTWFPTPRYLCRKSVVLNFLNEINDDKKRNFFLEVGIGAGDLILEMAKRNYQGMGIDISDEAVEITRAKLKKTNSNIEVVKKDLFSVEGEFGLVIILEVIEHIKEDEKALEKIYSVLNSNGYLIISAPAHKRDWSVEIDKWAGHYRRYDREELKTKLESAGFKIIKFYNYGFPVANVVKPIRSYLMRKDRLSEGYKKMNTERSGIYRNSQKKFSFLVNDITMSPFLFLQKFFFDKDLSNGYIVLAKK